MNLTINKNFESQKWNIKSVLSFVAIFLFNAFNCQTYTFTTAGATGPNGPNQAAINAAYFGTNLSGSVTVSSGIQYFTVPSTGVYFIDAYGAQGGGLSGGKGARAKGDFSLTAGQVLKIIIGQQGITLNPLSSGGGGAFVAVGSNTPLVIAGGGGGSGTLAANTDGTISTGGQVAFGGWPSIGQQTYNPGVSGNGGDGSTGTGGGGGGGGFFTNGTFGDNSFGYGFVNGGAGGFGDISGGFGGGGGARNNGGNYFGGGAGGGYSGGAGACGTPGNPERAGGGGSFNAGTNQTNIAGLNTGDGRVLIGLSCIPGAAPTDITSPNFLNICAGYATTLSVSGAGIINWYSSPTSTNILAGGSSYGTPTLSAGTYTFYAAATNTCAEGPRTPVTVTVSSTLPVGVSGGTTLVCPGSPLLLTATGADSYTWSTGATTSTVIVTPATNTFYTVMGTSTLNGCSGFSIKSVSVHPLSPVVALGSGSVCPGQSINLGASGAVSYTWEPGALNGFFVSVSPGVSTTYTVTGTDGNGCTNTASVNVTVIICSGLEDNSNIINETILYPNPNNGKFAILNNNVIRNIEVFDVSGRLVFELQSTEKKVDLDLTDLQAGIYYVKIKSGDSFKTLRVIKQ